MLFLLIFFKSAFSKNYFRNTIRLSNSLDPNWARHLVGALSGSKLFAKVISRVTSRQSVSPLSLYSIISPFDAFEISCI